MQTAAVLGGFFLSYELEEGFTRDKTDKTIMLGSGAVQINGATTVKSIYEDFDGSIVSLSPYHYEEYWGDSVISASGRVGRSEDGYGTLDFEAEFKSDDILNDWNDSDLNFYLIYNTEWDATDQDGVTFNILPEGFTQVSAFVQQTRTDGEQITGMAAMTVNPDEWTSLQIPFNSFMDITGQGELDLSKPISVGFAIPYLDNIHAGHFRNELNLNSRLRVDNLGLFKLNDSDPPGLIEAYEDEVDRAPGLFRIGGSHTYTDYTESDSGIQKINKGVDSEILRIDLVDDGPAGGFLHLSGTLNINEAILDFLDDNEDLYFIYSMYTGIDWEGFNSLSILIRSDTFESCYMEIVGIGSEQYYSGDFSMNAGWTAVKKPFSSINTEGGNMAEFPLRTDSVRIQFISALPRSSIRNALDNGVLEFSIDLDQILLQ